MKKGTKIHVIQEQNHHGTWEMTGHAFLDEKEARKHTDEKTVDWLIQNVPASVLCEELLELSEEAYNALDAGDIEHELAKLPAEVIQDFMDGHDHGQCGGAFSWETVVVEG